MKLTDKQKQQAILELKIFLKSFNAPREVVQKQIKELKMLWAFTEGNLLDLVELQKESK